MPIRDRSSFYRWCTRNGQAGATSRIASWIATCAGPDRRGRSRMRLPSAEGPRIVTGVTNWRKSAGPDGSRTKPLRPAGSGAGRRRRGRDLSGRLLAALRHQPGDDRRPVVRAGGSQLVRHCAGGRVRAACARRRAGHGARADAERLLDRAPTARCRALVLATSSIGRTVLLRFVEGMETARTRDGGGRAGAVIGGSRGLEDAQNGLDGRRRARALDACDRARTLTAGRPRGCCQRSACLKERLVALGRGLLPPSCGVSGSRARDALRHRAGHRARPRRRRSGARGRVGAAGPAARRATRPLGRRGAREWRRNRVRGSLEGRVVNWSTAGPVPGAEVLLILDDGASTTIRDEAEGRFSFDDRAGRSHRAITSEVLPSRPSGAQPDRDQAAGVRVRECV